MPSIRKTMLPWKPRAELARLRQAWEAGKASGKAKPIDIEVTIARARNGVDKTAPVRTQNLNSIE